MFLMSHSISIEIDIISDDEDEDRIRALSPFCTPVVTKLKKPRREEEHNNTVLVIIDDPTPQKSSAGVSAPPSVIPETPESALPMADAAIIRCTRGVSMPESIATDFHSSGQNVGGNGFICLESDSESDSEYGRASRDCNNSSLHFGDGMGSGCSTKYACCLDDADSLCVPDASSCHVSSSQNDLNSGSDEFGSDKGGLAQKNYSKANRGEKYVLNDAAKKKKLTREEKVLMMEEKKRLKEREKLHKAALKAEAAEMKKLQKEKQRWEKGKLALKSIVAEIDTKVVETGSVGGHLLTRLSEKGLKFRITTNPFRGSILWTMSVPDGIPQTSPEQIQIPYVLLVYEADEFCDQIIRGSLTDHVHGVRSHYPSYTVCYLTNRLMAYINKREKEKYKNPSSENSWRSPPVEETMAKLATNFVRVHSRHCMDEAEVAEHVLGLTCNLASCQYRKGLTRLSISANGSLIPKDCVDKNLLKKSTWLKALIAIPKVQPRFAIAIWKKYPTMKSLLRVYMDPCRSVHEKEFLLKDLVTEGLVGEDRRLGEVCSKRVYRVLMAQSGCTLTDDVELGADFFNSS